MALYFYEALSKEGKKVKGTLDSPTATNVKDQLTKQGLYPIKIELAGETARLSWFQRIFTRGISVKEKILFTKQLAILLKSGVPLLQAIELLIEHFQGRLKAALIEIKDEIKQGTSLADALNKYPSAFDVTYVQLVRAGEASGNLETILERLTHMLERQQETSKRISDAMRGPIIQLFVAAGVVTAMLTFVVPQMAENFAGQGRELPAPTRMLLTISDLITSHYIILLLVLIAIVGIFNYWRSTKSGKRILDTLKLKLPGIRYYAKTSAVVRFCQTLGMLLESGVNLAESLDIVVKIVDNQVLADVLQEARDKIIKQGKISQYLKQTGIFPPLAIYLIKTGEESGKLDVMLLTVADNYEKELTEVVDSMVAALQPVLLIIMAVIVGFIVMAIALPIMQMGDVGVL